MDIIATIVLAGMVSAALACILYMNGHDILLVATVLFIGIACFVLSAVMKPSEYAIEKKGELKQYYDITMVTKKTPSKYSTKEKILVYTQHDAKEKGDSGYTVFDLAEVNVVEDISEERLERYELQLPYGKFCSRYKCFLSQYSLEKMGIVAKPVTEAVAQQ